MKDRSHKPGSPTRSFGVDGAPVPVLKGIAAGAGTRPRTGHCGMTPPISAPTVDFLRNERIASLGLPRHLQPAPDGVDALFAWTQDGGDGAGQRLADIEGGWMVDHEDLVDHRPKILGGIIQSPIHGTQVLGVICAVDNSLGFVGVAPRVASVLLVSQSGQTGNVPDAIRLAVENLSPGDVLVLEVQLDTTPRLPAEADPSIFDRVRAATARGIVVIAAGGNGACDLDLQQAPGQTVFDRGNPAFRDSGAILVGACEVRQLPDRQVPRARHSSSNFGSRIDCYAWGDAVLTTDAYDITSRRRSVSKYTNAFSQTSAATAIIAGAALSLQGMAERKTGRRLTPGRLRELFRTVGTPSADVTDRIGLMPDLKRIIAGI